MSLIEIIRQIDWKEADIKNAAETLIADAKEYPLRKGWCSIPPFRLT